MFAYLWVCVAMESLWHSLSVLFTGHGSPAEEFTNTSQLCTHVRLGKFRAFHLLLFAGIPVSVRLRGLWLLHLMYDNVYIVCGPYSTPLCGPYTMVQVV